ncbi:MAG TPA: metallophosphoesterase family protein, partial [Anaerolineaceae bacterium]|nr:metallophosphoesterase family protein [Anaerolineaceae bacterium]
MTVIALIGDVHGNLPALEAVLRHAAEHGAEAVWNAGDLVGYGPFPEQVVRRLQKDSVINIQGNYDRKVLQVPEKAEKWSRTKDPEKWFAFRWAYDRLTPESRAFLAGLPVEQRIALEGWSILLVHGSPASQDEHLYPDTPEERLQELVDLARADVIVCGHSHQAFQRSVSGTL